MSRCESLIHPLDDGGCPGGHMSAGSCYCDCHDAIGQCLTCEQEFVREEMIEVVDEMTDIPGPGLHGYVCDACVRLIRQRDPSMRHTTLSCSLIGCACGGDEHMPVLM